eukprot:10834777-Prorocentrum_lima.AAC.1
MEKIVVIRIVVVECFPTKHSPKLSDCLPEFFKGFLGPRQTRASNPLLDVRPDHEQRVVEIQVISWVRGPIGEDLG